MSKKKPAQTRGQGSGAAGSRRAHGAAATKKEFPWGAALGSALLGLLLVGILAYAVLNTGEGAGDPLAEAREAVPGIEVADADLQQDHVPGNVEYDEAPPWGGAHNEVWSQCTGTVYDDVIPEEHAVHSLEHGAVWITHSEDLEREAVKALAEKVEGKNYTLLSPHREQTSPIVLTAWGHQLAVEDAGDERIETFIEEFANGPQTPEPGATCDGGTTVTGEDPA